MIKELKITRKTGLIDMFKERGYQYGVEIGTDVGDYAATICQRFPEVILFTIDPFTPYTEGDDVKTEKDMEAIFDQAVRATAPYPNCGIIKKTSMEAVKLFGDGSLDFVFIDGSHEYEDVYNDIVEWTKKVRVGGIVAGHDYVPDPHKKYGIIEAIHRYVDENNIDPLFILKKGSYVPCWMFEKK